MQNQIELNKELKDINPSLRSMWLDISNKLINIYWLDKNNNKCLIYDFETERYNFDYVIRFLATDEMDELQELIKQYETNPFKLYTNQLAKTLFKKNQAYGDSFTKSVDTYGLSVIGVRLSDKYNRIEHLITNHELKENDESLEDTLLDNAGYSILALKYLKEHNLKP